jgi:hypothetical protein
MSYNFTPLSDAEIDAINLLPDGDYDFEVIKSTPKISSNKNPMAELQLKFFDGNGKSYIVFDRLIFSTVPLNIRKVKHFCDSVGLREEYDRGSIREDLKGFLGKASIATEDKKPDGKGGMYPRKNIVVDYVVSDKKSMPKLEEKEVEFKDDDLPF